MKYIVGLTFAALTFGFVHSAVAQEVVTDEMIANADLKNGKQVYLRCAACHTLGEGERKKQGPNLWRLFGREAGTVEGQRYSQALASASFIWGVDELNAWLVKPKEFLPGTSMRFPGLPKEEQRIDVIAYIMDNTGYEPVSDDAATEADCDDNDNEAGSQEGEGETEGSE